MSNECIEVIKFLKRYGLSNKVFKQLHPAGIPIHEYQELCMATEYFIQDSDHEITKMRLIFLRITIRADKCSLPMMDGEFETLTEAAIRGFPSVQDKQDKGVDITCYQRTSYLIH